MGEIQHRRRVALARRSRGPARGCQGVLGGYYYGDFYHCVDGDGCDYGSLKEREGGAGSHEDKRRDPSKTFSSSSKYDSDARRYSGSTKRRPKHDRNRGVGTSSCNNINKHSEHAVGCGVASEVYADAIKDVHNYIQGVLQGRRQLRRRLSLARATSSTAANDPLRVVERRQKKSRGSSSSSSKMFVHTGLGIRTWLAGCSRVWEAVQQAPAVAEFRRTLFDSCRLKSLSSRHVRTTSSK